MVPFLFFGIPFLFTGLFCLTFPNPSGAVSIIVIGLAFCVGALWTLANGNRTFDEQMRQYQMMYPQWLDVINEWEMLFYCQRCGCAFHLTTRQVAPPQQMRRLLNRY